MIKLLSISVIIIGIIGILSFGISFLDRVPPINEVTKTCVVTGASSGIGCNISREMVKRGWKVIGIARRLEKLNDLRHELGQAFIPYACDIGKQGQIRQVCDQIKEQNLKPTLFFLNAGTGIIEDKFQPMLNNHKETFDVNYFGVITWVDEWLNAVRTYGGGTFVVTSSINAIFVGPGGDAYGASKAAIRSCFRSLSLQYRNDNIGFTVVLPGPVKTEMLKGAVKNLPFTHLPEDEARYIVEQVFNRKKQIEPSLYYYYYFKILSWLPDTIVLKII